MATDDAKRDDKTRAAAPAAANSTRPRARQALIVLGSVVSVLAAAFALALVAVPRRATGSRALEGPQVGPLTAQKVQVNLKDGRTFLVLDINVLYDAQSKNYFNSRAQDAVCRAEIRDALVATASAKTREEVSDPVTRPVWSEEIRRAIEPLLFPVHVGDTDEPGGIDPESGLSLGLSGPSGTFRGIFGDHTLSVDTITRTLTLDGGPSTSFVGTERDLSVAGPDGKKIFLDVSQLTRDFRGDVPVGVRGRVRRVLWNEMLLQ